MSDKTKVELYRIWKRKTVLVNQTRDILRMLEEDELNARDEYFTSLTDYKHVSFDNRPFKILLDRQKR